MMCWPMVNNSSDYEKAFFWKSAQFYYIFANDINYFESQKHMYATKQNHVMIRLKMVQFIFQNVCPATQPNCNLNTNNNFQT